MSIVLAIGEKCLCYLYHAVFKNIHVDQSKFVSKGFNTTHQLQINELLCRIQDLQFYFLVFVDWKRLK